MFPAPAIEGSNVLPLIGFGELGDALKTPPTVPGTKVIGPSLEQIELATTVKLVLGACNTDIVVLEVPMQPHRSVTW